MLQRELAEARQAQSEAQINILKKKVGIIHGKRRLIGAIGVALNLLQGSSRSRR